MIQIECPSGWRYVTLSELGEVNRGRSRHRPRHAPHLYGGPYPFIQTGDIKASAGRIVEFTQTYSDDGLKQSRLWPKETMCITIAATIAETGILTFPACFPDSVIGFIADTKECDVRFVEYCFRFLKRLIQHAASESGTVQDNINLGTFENLRFPIPATVDDQRAIARALGALDDKIELNRRLNRSLEELAQAVFRSWFVNFDPVTAKASGRPPVGLDPTTAALFPDHFQDSELGEIPEGWELCSLYDTANYVNGASFKDKDFCDPSLGKPVIKIVELKYGITDQTKFTQRELKADLLVGRGDLLYSWSGSPETSLDAYVWFANEGWLNQHIFKVVTESEAQKVFVYYLLRHLRPFLVETARNKQTTGLGHVTVKDMKKLQVVRPPEPILTAFDRYAGSCFRQWFNNEIQSRSLAAARDALLPPLLSGELRIKDAEKFLEKSL